jgi:hypothetical protein
MGLGTCSFDETFLEKETLMRRAAWFFAVLMLGGLNSAARTEAATVTPITPGDLAGASLIDFGVVQTNAPVDGQTINSVLFSFRIGGVNSADAIIDGGPGSTNNITVANVEGNTLGVLRMNFPSPKTRIGYGYALSIGGSVPTGTKVELFDASNQSLGSLSPATSFPDPTFAGGFWGVKSDTPFVRADVSFSALAPRFAFDNLRHQFVSQDVPEPSSLILLGLGAVSCAVDCVRRRRTLGACKAKLAK